MNKLENLPKYLALAILIVVPLYPKFPFINVPGTYVSIRLEDFLLGIVGIYVFVRYFKDLKSLIKENIERAILIFLGVGLLSVASGVFLTGTVVSHIALLHWARRVEYILPFFLGALVLRDKKEDIIEFFVKSLMIVVFVAFIYGAGQRYFNWPVIITQNLEYAKGIALRWIPGSHINSSFAGHYDLASFLVLVLPILITSFFVLKGVKTRVFLGITILSGLWLMASAISRISIVSYLGASILALVLVRKYKAILVVLLVSFLMLGTSSDLIARYQRIIEVTKKQFLRINLALPKSVYAQEESIVVISPTPEPSQPFEDRSTSIRLNVEWPRATRAFSKNPVLGTGFSSITLATDNDYLRLLGETGILGFASFLLIFARIGRLILKNLSLGGKYEGVNLAFIAGFTGALPGVLLNAVFIDVFEASKFAVIFWLLTGLAVETMRSRENG